MRFGPKPFDGGTRLDLWAPDVESVALVAGGTKQPLVAVGDGWWTIDTGLGAGDAYAFELPGGLNVPDPASRSQAGDVHGPNNCIAEQVEFATDSWLTFFPDRFRLLDSFVRPFCAGSPAWAYFQA